MAEESEDTTDFTITEMEGETCCTDIYIADQGPRGSTVTM